MAAQILLADEDRQANASLEEALIQRGHAVRTASSRAQARSLALKGVDVTVTQAALSDGDGMHLGSELTRIQSEREVIILTGRASIESAAAAVDAGMWAYLLKPCPRQALLSAIERAAFAVQKHAERHAMLRSSQMVENSPRLAS